MGCHRVNYHLREAHEHSLVAANPRIGHDGKRERGQIPEEEKRILHYSRLRLAEA